MENILEIKDLHISFSTHAGERYAVRGINLELKQGETVAVIGESGSGKSVLAQAITRILPQSSARYKRGSILFMGKDLLKKTEKEMETIRGNKIGMVFQDPMTALNPTMKIGNQIAESAIRHRGVYKHAARRHAMEMLRLVGIPQPEQRIDQYPHEFSGGMHQRAMIAAALSCSPKLLIADEPTTALDATIQAQMIECLIDIQKKQGISILFITHDLGIVAKMCQRVVVMYAGIAVESGTAEQIFYNPKHPYTRGLLQSIPRLEMGKNEPLYMIPGSPPDFIHPPKGCPFFARCEYAMEICRNHIPQQEEISYRHCVSCWLHHPMARAADSALQKGCYDHP